MADYLNPDALLTPLGSNASMYAPSYDQMLMSDVKRRMQAEESLRHQNYMNEQDRRAKPWLTEAAISEAKMKSDRDLAMADPAMVEAWKQGQLGGFDESAAKGKLAKGTVDSRMILENLANSTGTDQQKLYQNYYKLAGIYEPLQAMVKSGMPSDKIKGNIMRLFKQRAGQSKDWMSPEYMQAMEMLSANPTALLTVLNNQMGSIIDQAQRFDLTKIREKGYLDEKIAGIQEAGRVRSQSKDDTYKQANVLYASADRLEAQADKLEMDVNRGYIDISKDETAKKEYRTQINRKRAQANSQRKHADSLSGVESVAEDTPVPPPVLTPEKRAKLIQQLKGQ